MSRILKLRAPPRSIEIVGLLVGLAVASITAGCGNLTAGGLTGEAAVAVAGDVPSAQALSVPITAVPAQAITASENDEEPDGEVEVEFKLFLEGADGRSIALSDDEIRVRVDLRGRQEADVVNRQVPAMSYAAMRVVFTEIEAEVDSGLIIDGQVVTGAVRVELKDTNLTVVRPLSVEIREGERVQLLIDLNSAVWLQAVNPDLNRVAEEFFANALNLMVR